MDVILGALTRNVVAKDARCDDSSERTKQRLQFLLCQILRQSTNVQVGSFDGLAAWSRIRNLKLFQQIIFNLPFIPWNDQ